MNTNKNIIRTLIALPLITLLIWLLLFAGGLIDHILGGAGATAGSLGRIASANPPPIPPGDLTILVIGEAAKIYRTDSGSDVLLGTREPGGQDDFPNPPDANTKVIHCDPAA